MAEQPVSLDLGPESIPETLPILPLHDIVLFPKMVLPLVVMENQSIKLIDQAMAKDRLIGLFSSKTQTEDAEEKSSRYSPENLYAVGTSAVILKMAKADENKAQLMVQGISRIKVKKFIVNKSYLQAKVFPLDEKKGKAKESKALTANLLELYNRIVALSPGLPGDIGNMAKSIEDPGILADMITSTINSENREKQKILYSQHRYDD